MLKEGRDYTLSYAKNKAVTNGGAPAEIKITGKGSYKGTVKKTFSITQQNLKGLTVTAADQFVSKGKVKKPKVTITDLNGKTLKANTDFKVGTDYLVTGDDASGTVTVTVTGKGAYKGEVKAVCRYIQGSSTNIKKVKKGKKIPDQEYTGYEVFLNSTDLAGVLYMGSKSSPKTLLPGTDFVIVPETYKNNVKKGTAKLTVKGIGSYAGTKTVSFKIVRKKVECNKALINGSWQNVQ